jgi:hypothetical protein
VLLRVASAVLLPAVLLRAAVTRALPVLPVLPALLVLPVPRAASVAPPVLPVPLPALPRLVSASRRGLRLPDSSALKRAR